MYVLFQAFSVESLTDFDKKYVKFYNEMLCFSKLDGSLKFQNVPNF